MNHLFKKIVLVISIALFAAACSQNSERNKSDREQIQGRVQETVGSATDDTEMKNEGKWNTTKGKLRDAKEDVKDAVTN
jgi:uncharacterized protein YjbJ (UPF0337 family)